MTTEHRTHLTNDYMRSPFIAERRRNLFPTDGHDMDSELGHMSPIRSESDSDSDPKMTTCNDTPMSDRTNCSEYMSPLKLSPFTEGSLNYTPKKFSPTRDLKTPHDTSTKPVLQKEQKVLLEESKSLKRKSSLLSPESGKKPEMKNSKVRTALFQPANPLDISVPPRSFYSKSQEDVLEKIIQHKERAVFTPIKLNTHKATHKNGRRFGQINNGVKHKIRKPKQKKCTVAHKKMVETGSSLNEYIHDLSELKNKRNESQKLIIKPAVVEKNVDTEVETYFAQLKQSSSTIKPAKHLAENNKENIEAPSLLISPEANKNKKFFKSRNKLVTVNKTPTEEPKESHSTERLNANKLNLYDDFEDEDFAGSEKCIDDILSTLTDDESPPKTSALTNIDHNNENIGSSGSASTNLNINEHSSNINIEDVPSIEAYNSLLNFENSILLHDSNAGSASDLTSSVLSPISHMCDVTSGLALSSPVGKRKSLAAMLNVSSRVSKMLSFNGDCHSLDMEEKRKKVFPIFYNGASSGLQKNRQTKGEKRERSGDVVKRSAKKFRALDPDQMLLDAGQKKFGLTMCNECSTMYHMGDPNDEIQHLNYHNAHNILKFSGWKNEHVVANFQNKDRIIRVVPTDSKIWIKKVKDLMDVVLRDMGCYEMEYDISNSQVYLYIKSRTIAGCVVATTPKEGGHRMLPTIEGVSMCSEESYPIKCGITFLWVAENFRRQGIASTLVTAVKNNFILGEILTNYDVALTSPTEDGAAFAEKYFRSSNYLVFYV